MTDLDLAKLAATDIMPQCSLASELLERRAAARVQAAKDRALVAQVAGSIGAAIFEHADNGRSFKDIADCCVMMARAILAEVDHTAGSPP